MNVVSGIVVKTDGEDYGGAILYQVTRITPEQFN